MRAEVSGDELLITLDAGELPDRVSERPEDLVDVLIGSHLAAYIMQPYGCLSTCAGLRRRR